MLRFLRRKRRVLVIGLDCAPPELVFDNPHLPNLQSLMGTYGVLRSSIPCITVPAWGSMLSSRDPGVLGVYGFRNRANHTYDAMTIADSRAVTVPRVWDLIGEAGGESLVVGVPQTYPVSPMRGHLVSGFLTPDAGSAFTYPAVLKSDVLKYAPGYAFDVKPFRTDDKAALLRRVQDVTAQQFGLFGHLLKTKPWDFAMFVNMGTDRVHHGFWRYHDPAHRLYDLGNPFENAIRDYYTQVDSHIGELLNTLDDNVTVIVVSDHGVCRMDGGVCINEWLWRNGWLTLKTPPPEGRITRFEDADVDWSRTRAWGAGGYYGRVFLNVKNREPQGIVINYEAARDELAAALQAIPAPDGTPLNTTVYRPHDVYTEVNNIAPDLLVYFGGLHWRSVGSFGHSGIYTTENDTGPDDANHSPHGIVMMQGGRARGEIEDRQVMDIAPTILDRMRIGVPTNMQGRII